jgi:hypothetical protein
MPEAGGDWEGLWHWKAGTDAISNFVMAARLELETETAGGLVLHGMRRAGLRVFQVPGTLGHYCLVPILLSKDSLLLYAALRERSDFALGIFGTPEKTKCFRSSLAPQLSPVPSSVKCAA